MKIKELILSSSNIDSMKDFYSQHLGIPIVESTKDKLTLKIGSTRLHFISNSNATPYHYAINIPSNQIQQALQWLQEKVTILKDGKNNIIDFSSWNSEAIYFYDPDHNIVELIARKNLKNQSSQSFHPNDLIEVSEIGVVSDDIEKQYNFLNTRTGIEIFDGSFERFCAVGDENGLFICIDKEKKDWFPTGDKAIVSDFTIVCTIHESTYRLSYKKGNWSMVN